MNILHRFFDVFEWFFEHFRNYIFPFGFPRALRALILRQNEANGREKSVPQARSFFFVFLFLIKRRNDVEIDSQRYQVNKAVRCMNLLRRCKKIRQGIICRRQASLMFGICHECYFITNSRFYFALHFFSLRQWLFPCGLEIVCVCVCECCHTKSVYNS